MIGEACALRHLLGTLRPDLLAWTDDVWHDWLDRQQQREQDRSLPQLLLVANLCCLSVLSLHVGLHQLLALPDFRASLLLILPTEEAARLLRAQARREGWEWLLRVSTVAEFEAFSSSRLQARFVAHFCAPVSLPPGFEEDLAGFAEGPIKSRTALRSDAAAFIGDPANYGDWLAASKLTEQPDANTLSELISTDVHHLVIQAKPAQDSLPDEHLELVDDLLRVEGGAIEILNIDENSEVVLLATLVPEGPRTALARIAGSQGEPAICHIRPPPALLTTRPQTLRLERHLESGAQVTDFLLHVPPSDLAPWMVSAFLNRGGAGNPVIRAFAEGIGCRIGYAEDEPARLKDIPVVWGVLRESDRILAQAKAQDLYFFYIDHAYFNRGHGKTYRITRNSYEAGAVRRFPRDRLDRLEVKTAPWKTGGREIIVCPPTDHFVKAHGCYDWLDDTLERLQAVTDRPVIIRRKPVSGEAMVPLEEALNTAHALVTHSSNVAIEAACYGTPVFVSPTSAAAPVGCTDLSRIESPVYPDREPWLAHLAYNQFSFEEIGDGRAWRMLLDLEGREFV